MARGRMLSKEISLDEKVDALSDDTARLLWTWLIPHLDVEGRMYGEPEVFKSIVAPRRNYSTKKIEKYLTEMEKLYLIIRYSVDGNCYLFAPNFEKHQIGLRKDRETQSRIPSPPPDLLRSDDGISPAQVKVKVKEKEKENIELDINNKDNILISGQSIEKAKRIVKGEVSGVSKRRREFFKHELERLGVPLDG